MDDRDADDWLMVILRVVPDDDDGDDADDADDADDDDDDDDAYGADARYDDCVNDPSYK